MNNSERHTTALHYLIVDANQVMGEWNGDEPGRLEDRTNVAEEIIAKAEELRTLIEEIEEL